MAMTKALKNSLQKIIDATKDSDIKELWDEFTQRTTEKENKLSNQFAPGDEVSWTSGEFHCSGTITRPVISKNKSKEWRVRQNNSSGSMWTIPSCLLTKEKTLKV